MCVRIKKFENPQKNNDKLKNSKHNIHNLYFGTVNMEETSNFHLTKIASCKG